MKVFINVFMCFILAMLTFSSQASANHFQAHVIEAPNHYTIKVLIAGEVKVIRIAEIICPSTRFDSLPCATEAKNFLNAKTAGKDVTLVFWALDVVGRSVCEVFLPDGTSLGKLMVAKGYALQDRYYSYNSELSSLEQTAQSGKLGIWEYVAQVL